MDTTTITIDLRVKRLLDNLKRVRRESYNDVLTRVLPKSEAHIDSESLHETIEILSDPETMASLARSMEDVRNGRLFDIDEV